MLEEEEEEEDDGKKTLEIWRGFVVQWRPHAPLPLSGGTRSIGTAVRLGSEGEFLYIV